MAAVAGTLTGLGIRSCNRTARRLQFAHGVELDRSGALNAPRLDSRVLVFSQRGLHRASFHAPQYEFEDVLTEIDDVVLLSPPACVEGPVAQAARHVVNGAKKRAGVARRTPSWNWPVMATSPVEGEHDLFFAIFNDAYQISYLNNLPGWRQRCRRAVCFLLEAWSSTVVRDADYYRLLSEFDAVYLFTPASAPALRAVGVPEPRFLAAGTDALTFAPRSPAQTRPIDVLSYGRTSPVVHHQLLKMVSDDDLTYLYDTQSDGAVLHFPEHRLLQASLMRRTSYFIAHAINDSPVRRERTGGEESLTTRYFEGAAGGAIMLGSSPPIAEFDANFDWTDAVIDMPWDCPDVRGMLHDLGRQPERLAVARSAAISNSLRRHDWVYRWEQVLADAGLPLLPAALARQAELAARAAAVAPDLAPERYRR